MASAERAARRGGAQLAPLLYAWRVVFDAGTWTTLRSDTRALVSETTRLDGVRHIPASLSRRGDLRGVAVFRKLCLVGVAKLAWLVHLMFSDCAPHLLQLAKMTGGRDDTVQVCV